MRFQYALTEPYFDIALKHFLTELQNVRTIFLICMIEMEKLHCEGIICDFNYNPVESINAKSTLFRETLY